MAHDVKVSGHCRGYLMELAFADPRPSVPTRFLLAGFSDLARNMREFGEHVAEVTAKWSKLWSGVIDEAIAYESFMRDGGDPEEIHAIEEMFNVDSTSFRPRP